MKRIQTSCNQEYLLQMFQACKKFITVNSFITEYFSELGQSISKEPHSNFMYSVSLASLLAPSWLTHQFLTWRKTSFKCTCSDN